MLLTGFPAPFVRSPDCTTLRSLLATGQNRKAFPDAGVGSPVRACETAILLIRSNRGIIQTQTGRFRRVSYSGPSAEPADCTKRDQRLKPSSAHFERDARSRVRTNKVFPCM
jgi:hypothetical protein